MTRVDDLDLIVQPPAVVIHTATGLPAWRLADIKAAAGQHPGPYRLALQVGRHTLTLGPTWRVQPSPELVAALKPFGSVEVLEDQP